MAQWVKAPALKPDNSESLISGTSTWQKKSSPTYEYHDTCTYTHRTKHDFLKLKASVNI